MQKQTAFAAIVLSFTTQWLSLTAHSAESPQAPTHLGAASCASSNCHGSSSGFASTPIGNDEYLIWHRQDRHARAYQLLLLPASQAIARQLGKTPAHQRGDCLSCHAAPPALQAERAGRQFQIEDGIDCETCHGAASDWLQAHTHGARSEQERRQLGLFPTWSVTERAALCASCHVGDAKRPITHEVMAAGHPALNFELDTYLASMPPHHRPSAAQTLGKPETLPLQQWLQGQIAASQALISRLPELSKSSSLFPELALFDCYACHHDLNQNFWRAQRAPGQGVGSVRLADTALQNLQLWLDGQGQGDALRAARSDLNHSLFGEHADRAERLNGAIRALESIVAAQSSDMASSEDTIRHAARALQLAGVRYPTDFALAQQAAMLAGVLTESIKQGATTPTTRLLERLEQVRNTVGSSQSFDPQRFSAALYAFRTHLPKQYQCIGGNC